MARQPSSIIAFVGVLFVALVTARLVAQDGTPANESPDSSSSQATQLLRADGREVFDATLFGIRPATTQARAGSFRDGGEASEGTLYRNSPPVTQVAQRSSDVEIIRGSGTAPSGVRPPAPTTPGEEAAAPAVPSPFGPMQFRMPTLGVPEGLGTPQPTEEAKRRYAKYVEKEVAPENTIQVVEGRATKIRLRERPRRIYIPDETVADFQVITDQEFAVVGRRQGTTVLDLWFANPANPDDPNQDEELEYLVMVLPDIERAALETLAERRQMEARAKAFQEALKVLEGEIKKVFPDSAVELTLVGDQTVVRGECKDVVEAAHILRIVGEHVPDTRRRPTAAGPPINAVFIPGMSGLIDERAAVDAIREILQAHPNLVNLLRIPGEQQVMLMVTVAEVNRDAARSVGLNFSISEGATVAGQVTGGLLAAAGGNPSVLANIPISIDNGEALLAIRALRTLNLARSLAEPNLTTLNGRTANFHAGGSFPVSNSVILQGGAAQSVTYIPLGVDLAFTPFITDRNRIRLELHADVSSASTNTTQVSGGQVPSNLDRRTFNTTVELREGQTLAVAGLIQKTFNSSADRIPLWGDLPIIGHTGGLDNVSSSEQELVVLVTPVLVHPLDRCDTPQLPGSDIFEPGDLEFYLLGHLEGRRTEDYRASVRTDYARQIRYTHCNDMFIIGPHGPTYACCSSEAPCGDPCQTPEAAAGHAFAASLQPGLPAEAVPAPKP